MEAMSVDMLRFLLALVVTSSIAQAATLTVTNFDGPTSRLLTRHDGTLFTNGLVRVGSFGVGGSAVQDAFNDRQFLQLEEQFQQFGRAVSVSFSGLPGLYQDVVTQAATEGDEFVGQPIYTVISDSGRIRDAGNLLIFEHDAAFLADGFRNEPALLDEKKGTLLVGEFNLYRRSLDQIVNQPTFTLVRTIPEPSVLVLCLLACGCASRRQRA